MAAVFIVGGLSISTACAENFSNGVTVSTDKLEYQQGEVIRVVITNNLRQSIFSHIRSLTPVFGIKHIEKKNTNEHWERLYAQCQFPHCTYEIDAPGEIKPGENEAMEWKQLVFVDGTAKTALPEPGVYRLAISYEEYQKTKWQSVLTNTFTINQGRRK